MHECRICNEIQTEFFISVEFRQKLFLPSNIDLIYCDKCQFLFNRPVDKNEYKLYYSSNKNDQFGDLSNVGDRFARQADILSEFFVSEDRLNILDVGCGNADLLKELSARFPHHNFFGLDYNSERAELGGITIVEHLDQLGAAVCFDIIIMSHTLEHITDFLEFGEIVHRLKKTGIIYVEVPDSERYAKSKRREFLYYIDRLHVNHFSRNALFRLARNHGVDLFKFGQIDFDYKDGHPYPALFALGSRSFGSGTVEQPSDGFGKAVIDYLESENSRWSEFRRNWAGKSVAVYGFGDNFFRMISKGGPLSLANIVAVFDRDWSSLVSGAYGGRYNFLLPDDAVRQYSDTPVFVTLSWGGEDVVERLKKLGFNDVSLI